MAAALLAHKKLLKANLPQSQAILQRVATHLLAGLATKVCPHSSSLQKQQLLQTQPCMQNGQRTQLNIQLSSTRLVALELQTKQCLKMLALHFQALLQQRKATLSLVGLQMKLAHKRLTLQPQLQQTLLCMLNGMQKTQLKPKKQSTM